MARDSSLDWIKGKISETVRGMNLQETISAIEKAACLLSRRYLRR